MGDFFELFSTTRKSPRSAGHRADQPGRTRRRADPDVRVPVHSAESYLARLIKAGCRVAIAEQVETPEEAKKRGGSKALVARDIVRFVTAGTLTEEALLEPRRANVLAAVCEVRGLIGIAACDISTGRMELEECEPAAMGAALARLGASEIVASEDWADAPFDAVRRPGRGSTARRRGAWDLHGVSTLDGFGRSPGRCWRRRTGWSIISTMSGAAACRCCCPVARTAGGHMAMDEATRASLEILVSTGGTRKGSLFEAIDRCVTGAGAPAGRGPGAADRRAAIRARLELVSWLHDDPLLRGDLRAILKAAPDIGRALGRSSPGAARAIWGSCAMACPKPGGCARCWARAQSPALAEALLPTLGGHGALIDLYVRALVPAPPTERAQGGFIAEGYDAALDELRRAAGNSRRAIAALEAKYRDETGVSALKIRHNGVLGYFIEVPARHADKLMLPDSGFTHRQTMAGAVRFNALALHEEASRIAEAGGHALAAEEAHFEELVAAAVSAREGIAATAAALAGSTSRAGRPNARRRRLGAAACRGGAGAGHRRRAASGGGGGARGQGRTLRRQRLPARRPRTGCGWSAAPTWAASPPSCARTR
jgi:DNA mismatch repair protein MutS